MFVVIIKIPLIFAQNFNLYHIIPFPVLTNKFPLTYKFIEPTFDYLLINDVRTRYVKINSLDIRLPLNLKNIISYFCHVVLFIM